MWLSNPTLRYTAKVNEVSMSRRWLLQHHQEWALGLLPWNTLSVSRASRIRKRTERVQCVWMGDSGLRRYMVKSLVQAGCGSLPQERKLKISDSKHRQVFVKDFSIFSGQEKLKQNRLQFHNQERPSLISMGREDVWRLRYVYDQKGKTKGKLEEVFVHPPLPCCSSLLSAFSIFFFCQTTRKRISSTSRSMKAHLVSLIDCMWLLCQATEILLSRWDTSFSISFPFLHLHLCFPVACQSLPSVSQHVDCLFIKYFSGHARKLAGSWNWGVLFQFSVRLCGDPDRTGNSVWAQPVWRLPTPPESSCWPWVQPVPLCNNQPYPWVWGLTSFFCLLPVSSVSSA